MMGKDNNKVENHNKGQKDGAHGNVVTDIIRETSRLNSGRSKYDEGYVNVADGAEDLVRPHFPD